MPGRGPQWDPPVGRPSSRKRKGGRLRKGPFRPRGAPALRDSPEAGEGSLDHLVTATPIIGAAAAAISAIALSFPGCAKEKTVPDVKGQPLQVARRIVADAGFETQSRVVYSNLPPGVVSGTDPAGGAKTGSDLVTIRISRGPGDAAIPDTTGLQSQIAAEALEKAGYVVEQTMITSALVQSGLVVRSSPPAGTAKRAGSTVVLLVSGGARTTAIPDVTGASVSKALESLRLARLRPLVLPAPGIGDPGKVGAQSPGPGQVSAVGTTVRLWVDRQPRSVKVPRLVGLTGGSAGALLQNQGVEPRYITVLAKKPREIGNVVKQSPAPGASVKEGGAVTMTIGIIPSRKEQKAPAIAESYGLRPDQIDTFSFIYMPADCPGGRGIALVVPDIAIPYKQGSAKVTYQGPVDLGGGRTAQVAVVKTTKDFVPGSAEVAIRIQPCPKK